MLTVCSFVYSSSDSISCRSVLHTTPTCLPTAPYVVLFTLTSSVRHDTANIISQRHGATDHAIAARTPVLHGSSYSCLAALASLRPRPADTSTLNRREGLLTPITGVDSHTCSKLRLMSRSAFECAIVIQPTLVGPLIPLYTQNFIPYCGISGQTAVYKQDDRERVGHQFPL